MARRYRDGVIAQERGTDLQSPAETLLGDDLARAIQQTVDRLPERGRLVFTLSRYQGLSHAEIARELKISIPTVETQISRALKKLRVALQPFLSLTVTVIGAGELTDRFLS